jgi:hypothetical protein
VRRRAILSLAALVCVLAVPTAGHAQVFLASRPAPTFTIGPLFVRANVGPQRGPVVVELLWSLVVPPGATAAAAEDLYLLWPGTVTDRPGAGPPSPELARYVESRGFAVVDEGRLPLSARNVAADSPAEVVAGGAPFVTYVGQGGPLGLTTPASWIRIPSSPKLADRRWMLELRLSVPDLTRPRPASWLERLFWGPRYRVALGFHDLQSRALFPMYLEHRDRVVRLAEEPSQILLNFSQANRLKIEDVAPAAAHRGLSETLENTEVVSHFLDPSEGLSPQVLSVAFAYFSGLQAWAPVLIPTLFFVLGNLAAVVVRTVADRIGRLLAGRLRFAPPGADGGARQTGVVLSRETLARILPGVTTYADVLRLCGPEVEHTAELNAPNRRTLVYRGRRLVPQRRHSFGWLMTVRAWTVEHHEVEIELAGDVVADVRARVRRSPLERSEAS